MGPLRKNGSYMLKSRQWKCDNSNPFTAISALAVSFATYTLFASSAFAQTQGALLDQYISPTAGGGGGFQNVLTRGAPEYASSGIHVGNFIIRPSLSETVGYDSNIFATSQARGSALIETSASLGASSDWSTDRLQLALSVDDLRYPSQPALSSTNWSTTIGGSHDFGRDVATATYSHQALTLTPTALDVPQLQASLPFTIDDLQVSHRINLSRIYILPSIDLSSYNLNGSAANYSASNFNRIQVSPTLTVGYELATQRNVVVVLRDANALYGKASPGTILGNYNDIALLSGLDYGANGIIRFRFLVGYEFRQFQSTQYKNIAAPIAEASLIWTPTGLTAVTGTASRSIQASTEGAAASYTQNYVQVRVDHEYLPNVRLRADAGVYFTNYETGGSSQTLYTVGAGATYLLNRNMQMTFSYDFSARDSNQGANTQTIVNGVEIFGSNYTDHRVTLQLRLGL